MLERFREKAFWLIDAIKGRPINTHLNEIKLSINSDIRNETFPKKLHNLLTHATETVPFYRDYFGKEFTKFPVVDKAMMRANSLFLSSAFNDSNRVSLVTSGSTGTPFKIYQNIDKKNRNSADTIYFANEAGFNIGNRLAYLKIWSEYNKKSALKLWLQNIQPLDVIKLDDSIIKHFIESLNAKSTYGILGYSSALDLLARYIERNSPRKKTNVHSIIAMSEAFSEETKKTLTEYFGTQAVSRYSNIENGIIAQQETDGSKEFRINTASYLVEILDFEYDKPVLGNELGRIVVTDLYNYAMPMIRYDTGDVGSFTKHSKDYLQRIEGRKLDQIFDTKGKLISSYIVYKNMWQYTDIIQYQFVQFGEKDYVFKINTDTSFNKQSQLIKEFKKYLGEDANFHIEFVDEIPLLSSGKRKKIVNTFHNKK